MFLFLLNTPTQLLNAMALIHGRFREEDSDAYYTENLRQFFGKPEIKAFFRNAYPVKLLPDICKRGNVLQKSIVRIKNALDFGKIVNGGLPSDPAQYTRVFASGISLRNYEIYYAVKVRNRNVNLSLFEEGICEYYNLGRKSIPQILFSDFFFGHYYKKEADSLFVYQPAAAVCVWKNIAVKPIPKAFDPGLRQSINAIFGYKKTNLSQKTRKAVFLEQAFHQQEEEEKQRELVRKLERTFGKDNIIIKLHPRSENQKYGAGFTCCETSIPLEVILMNEDISHHLFISVSSSAVLNFRLMFGLEPDTVVLNRLDRAAPSPSDPLFDYVRDHAVKGNFWIPKNEGELDALLEALKGNEREQGF